MSASDPLWWDRDKCHSKPRQGQKGSNPSRWKRNKRKPIRDSSGRRNRGNRDRINRVSKELGSRISKAGKGRVSKVKARVKGNRRNRANRDRDPNRSETFEWPLNVLGRTGHRLKRDPNRGDDCGGGKPHSSGLASTGTSSPMPVAIPWIRCGQMRLLSYTCATIFSKMAYAGHPLEAERGWILRCADAPLHVTMNKTVAALAVQRIIQTDDLALLIDAKAHGLLHHQTNDESDSSCQ